MKGIHFNAAKGSGETLRPDFFKDFPEQAFEARNMVWDSVMFLSFSQAKFDSVNQTIAFDRNNEMNLAGSGTFTNKNVELTWSGYGERNGRRCLLIDYRAFGNPLTVNAGGMEMHGRSDYWGQIWINAGTHEIEYGTLFEDVLMQMTMPGQAAQTVSDVFRSGTFEALVAR